MKDLLEQLQHVCDRLRNANEIAIIERYGYSAKCYTITLLTGKLIFFYLYNCNYLCNYLLNLV